MERNVFLAMTASQREQTLAELLCLDDSQGPSNTLARVYMEAQLLAAGLAKKNLVALFEASVEKCPSSIALVYGDRTMTYSELNRRANQVAHQLIDDQHDRSFVGLYVEPSIEMIVGLLGILKAGGAYVPIDAKNAVDRIGSMVEDIELKCLLTTKSLHERFPVCKAKVYCLDDAIHWPTELCTNPLLEIGGIDFAYVIYTSGSTGRPKGVPIAHYNVVHLFESCDRLFEFSCEDIWTCFHSVSFDFSVWEIWGALLKGGRLVVVPFTISRNYPKFYNLLVHEKVTVLSQTPTAFRLLVQTDQILASASMQHSLRYIIFGGEALDIAILAPWIKKYGDSSPKLINMYGITETTVHVTFRRILEKDLDSTDSLIGWPLPGVSVVLFDAEKQPVELGAEGEIYVGGLGLSMGYLNRDALTKEKFVDNPLLRIPGAKLYRSGDLAKFSANGELCYIGRIDNQVQIHGYRVELGEIECAVRDLNILQDAIVFIHKETSDQAKIVLVYRSIAGVEPSHKMIRERLRKKIPEYMLPDYSIRVDEFPLNKNGKLDRVSILEMLTI